MRWTPLGTYDNAQTRVIIQEFELGPVQFYDGGHERETETAARLGAALLQAIEAADHFGSVRDGNAWSAIRHDQNRPAVLHAGHHRDIGAIRGVRNGIVEKIRYQLQQQLFVAADRDGCARFHLIITGRKRAQAELQTALATDK
jgi:hypothetical protein